MRLELEHPRLETKIAGVGVDRRPLSLEPLRLPACPGVQASQPLLFLRSLLRRLHCLASLEEHGVRLELHDPDREIGLPPAGHDAGRD
jgi:hypothetical protein